MKKKLRITDTVRIDWLQKNPWALEDCVDIVNMGKGKNDPIGFSFADTPVYELIRKALDAAIRANSPASTKED